MMQQIRRPATGVCVAVLFTLLCVSPSSASGQDTPSATLRGVVVDARDGTPLRRVSVRLQGGSTTITGEDGRFEIGGVPVGTQELYVSVVDFILVKRTITVPVGGVLDLTIPVAPGTGTYSETVTVRPGNEAATATTAVGEQALTSSELQQLRGLITNDPFRAIQVLPGVASGDDLRSEFTVRGNAIDHMNFTFEGVTAPFLVHTVQGVHDGGSIAMINGDLLDDIVLSTGSYPQHFGGRTGAELDFRMREGSRDGVKSHLSVSLTDLAFVLEGPLGGGRGSWLASARKSYLDRLIKQLDSDNDFAFGFIDGQAKLVYDLNSRHQLQLALTVGQSQLDREPELLDLDEVKDGRNSTAIAVGTWRYLASPRFILTQKISGSVNRFRNTSKQGAEIDRGSANEALYRLDWSYAPGSRVTLGGGGHIGRSAADRRTQRLAGAQFAILEDFSSRSLSESAYAEARVNIGRGSINGGARIDHWALTGDTLASPWLLAMWPIAGSVNLRAGAGIYRQAPRFVEIAGLRGTPDLISEHALQFDVALEGRLGTLTKWEITGYDREDRDLIRVAEADFKIVNNTLAFPSLTSPYQNALDGHSRGVEFLLQRRTPNGLSGWLSYALSYTEYLDRLSGDTFWGDWDQRHTVNAYATYRFNAKYSASTRFRYGSNFPAPGYWEARGDQFFVGTTRNDLRVKPYSRLDMRVNRTFSWQQKRLTLFLEILNAYNRTNVRYATGGISTRTFETFGLFDNMFPRIPSVGFLLEF